MERDAFRLEWHLEPERSAFGCLAPLPRVYLGLEKIEGTDTRLLIASPTFGFWNDSRRMRSCEFSLRDRELRSPGLYKGLPDFGLLDRVEAPARDLLRQLVADCPEGRGRSSGLEELLTRVEAIRDAELAAEQRGAEGRRHSLQWLECDGVRIDRD